jgi:putative ABC transport system substrate-binding protein
MNKKMVGISSLFLASMLALGGCSSSNSTSYGGKKNVDEKQYTIGVTQIVEHPSLDAAFVGFKKALEENGFKEGKNVKYDVQNAQGDPNNNSTIAANLASSNVDLIFANSTPSAQSALNATKDIPIIFTSVTDPVGAGLVKSLDQPGDNITGTTDSHPDAIGKTIKFMTKELKAKKIGIIFNSGEQNSKVQVDEVKKVAKEEGASVVEVTVSTSAEVKQAAESLVGRVDAMYVPTDNTVVSALESVISVANDNKLPLCVGELDSMKRGAVAASGFSYEDLGYQTGLMAVEVLKGNKKPSEIPVALPKSLKLMINKQAAEKQGVKVDDSWSDMAEFYDGKE